MNVADLAKQFNTTNEMILKTLKSLKLKAKDSQQELNPVVVSVLRNEFAKFPKGSAKPAVETPKVQEKTDKELKQAVEEKEKPKPAKAKEIAQPKAPKKIIEKTAKTAKKKPSAKEPKRPEIRLGQGPLITLKPLARRRKKPTAGSRQEQQARSLPTKEALEETTLLKTDVRAPKTPGSPTELKQPSTVETSADVAQKMAQESPLPDLEVKVPITVKEFSAKIQQKPNVILKQLMQMGVFAHINQSLDGALISKIAGEFGFNLVKVKTQEEQLIEFHKREEEDPKFLKPRAPVVTFMGHVDHGKTTLLDKIRKTKVADAEHGGITQHIGAYSVDLAKGRITFLDTPGHEAFTAMRARGANITDLVVLVVAADEGVMPQTEEAIDHARAADVPIVVALTKIDRANADVDRVKKDLSERGFIAEDWGGKTVVVGVSAVTGEGVDNLLEMILLEAELLELKANAQKKASGIVVEAHLSQGKGVVATLIIQSGTLHKGDLIVVGAYHGRVKAMFDDHQRSIKEAGPSMPVEVMGVPKVPEAGELFYVVDDEKQGREITNRRQEQLKNKKLQPTQKFSLEDLYAQVQEGSIKELNVILKADVQGSSEALKDSLEKIPSDKVKIKFIHMGVGDVSASDVLLAVASKAIIIAFHVGIGPRAKEELEKEPVDVRQYRIIYDAVNDMKKALEGLLERKTLKKFLSRVEIRKVFKLSRGIVAGCYVTKGRIHRKVNVDILRDNELVFSGTLSSLKRMKDDVREVNEGMECGLTFNGFDKIQEGDIVEAYELESVAQQL